MAEDVVGAAERLAVVACDDDERVVGEATAAAVPIALALAAGTGWPLLVRVVLWSALFAWLVGKARKSVPGRPGDDLLEIDPTSRTLRLPAQPDAPRVRHVVPFDRVQAVEVTQSDQPHFGDVKIRWHATEGNAREARVALFGDPVTAREMADWMARRTGTPVTTRDINAPPSNRGSM